MSIERGAAECVIVRANFMDDLRDVLAAQLARDGFAVKATDGVDALLLKHLNVQRRRIQARPRPVEWSKELREREQSLSAEQREALVRIEADYGPIGGGIATDGSSSRVRSEADRILTAIAERERDCKAHASEIAQKLSEMTGKTLEALDLKLVIIDGGRVEVVRSQRLLGGAREPPCRAQRKRTTLEVIGE
jgi:hypothetical protein